MKKIMKYLLIVPFYIFLLAEGFTGGGVEPKDVWDNLMEFEWEKYHSK